MQARSYLTSGNCTCQAATGARAGKALDFIWKSGGQQYIYNACPVPGVCSGAYCNPYNCTNTKCFSNGCTAARAGFCGRYGKPCPDDAHKKCYGPQGQDPCPGSGCNKSTEDAIRAVTDYLMDQCSLRSQCGDCIGIYSWMKGNLSTGWKSGIEDIRKSLCTGAKIGGMTREAFIAYLANRFRCSAISDKAFVNCRGGCPGGTCNGMKCNDSQNLNANTCHCDAKEDPITTWFRSSCHLFDFLPWGGCQKETQTVVFGGAVLLGIVLLFTILRR